MDKSVVSIGGRDGGRLGGEWNSHAVVRQNEHHSDDKWG